MIGDLFEYTDIDGDKFQVYQSWGDYYFKINHEGIELPKDVLLKLIEMLKNELKI